MDPDLETVIRKALDDARAAGKDYLTQTEEAVRAVLKVRPDTTASAALTAVEEIQVTDHNFPIASAGTQLASARQRY